ncbi:hypothetical protein vseg_012832 [Gypsophila vaccaria]
MAIQAHIHQNNLESTLPFSYPNYFFTANNNNDDNNNNLVYNGCVSNEFSYNNLQHKLLQQQHQQLQQQQQQYLLRRNLCGNNNNNNNNGFVFLQPTKKQKRATNATTTTTATTTSTTTTESDNYMSLNEQFEKQGHEIDRFIVLQNERLKLALQQQSKRQFGLIYKNFEQKTAELLKQKDNELANATKKTFELQEIVTKLDVENQTWQGIASQNEAMVFSLNNTLEQLQQQQQQRQQQQRQQGGLSSTTSNNVVDDAESCCDDNVSKKNVGSSMCKVCKSRKGSVVVLPCKHMCCCKVCDEFIVACPLCNSPKLSSIQALFS